jgi:hypothetical protein
MAVPELRAEEHGTVLGLPNVQLARRSNLLEPPYIF